MGWLVQATDYRKWNEPPRPRLQRNGTIYLMARRPLLCQGVSRAVLLASSITERKSAARKQRTYRPTSLRGEFLLQKPAQMSKLQNAGFSPRSYPSSTASQLFGHLVSWSLGHLHWTSVVGH